MFKFGTFLSALGREPRNLALRAVWLFCLMLAVNSIVPMAKAMGMPAADPMLQRALQAGLISSATFNPMLTSMAVKYIQDTSEFVGMKLAPLFPTGERSADYPVWDKENAANVPDLKPMAPGSSYGRSLSKMSDDKYYCEKRGHEAVAADENVRRYGSRIALDRAEVTRVLGYVRVNHELRVKKLATGGSVSSSSPGTKWDAGGSDPVIDIRAAKAVIRGKVGRNPDTIVISNDVFTVLEDHAKITNRLSNASDAIVDVEFLARLFKVRQVLVAGGLINTANDGQAISIGEIWGDSVVLACTSTARDLAALNFMRTFGWTGGDTPAEMSGPDGIAVRSYRADDIDSDIHKVNHFTDEKLVAAEAGYHLSSVLT